MACPGHLSVSLFAWAFGPSRYENGYKQMTDTPPKAGDDKIMPTAGDDKIMPTAGDGDLKVESATASTTEGAMMDINIINEDLKVIEHFAKLLKEKRSAMKIVSRSEKVNRDEMISVNLVYGDSIKTWRTTLGSKATVKALVTAIIHEHGIPENKQKIHINGEGSDIAMMDRKSVLFNFMVRKNTNIVITRKPGKIWPNRAALFSSPTKSSPIWPNFA